MITLGKRSIGKENNWERVEKIKGKTIIFFGGNTTDSEQAANGNIKMLQRIADLDPQDYSLLSVSYGSEVIGDNHNVLRSEVFPEIEEFFDKYFEPLLYNQYHQIRSEQGLCKSFQRIVFFAHCAGCDVVDYLISLLRIRLESLKEEGYKITNVDNLIRKIQVIAYAPHQMLSQEVRALYIAPLNDSQHTWHVALKSLDGKKDREYPPSFTTNCKRHWLMPGNYVTKVVKENGFVLIQKGLNVVVIPGKIGNGNNDHSIECLIPETLKEGQEESKIAYMIRHSLRKSIRLFLDDSRLLSTNCHGINMRDIYDVFDSYRAREWGEE
ncbi:MAG: hypothetical protein IJ542_00840 [Clostridia bacterium]|nr:hypothetical protein [Clostridia bacterium]